MRKLGSRVLPFLIAVVLLLVSFSFSGCKKEAREFVHPGLLNSLEELQFMKDRVLAMQEPWLTGYKVIPTYIGHKPNPVEVYKDDGKGTYPAKGYLKADAEAAYGSALHWFVTGEKKHAEKAIEIINAWAHTLKEIPPRDAEGCEDNPLSTSYGWPGLIYAAEIIRSTYDGWLPEDQEKFKEVLLKVVWPGVQGAEDKKNYNNWRSMAIFCRTAIAIYCDDEEKFNYALDKLKDQIGKYIYPSGQTIETMRDLWHTQMGIAPLAAAAEMFWHQGVDVYSYLDNRILKGTEWQIPFIRGDFSNWPTKEETDSQYYKYREKPKTKGDTWAFYELVYNHYHNRMGIDTPNTWEMLSKTVPGYEYKFPVRPEMWQRTGGWGTLTHVRHDLIPKTEGEKPVIPSPKPIDKRKGVKIRKNIFPSLTGKDEYPIEVGPGVYQAEDAYISNGKVVTEHVGYTGEGFVDYKNEKGTYLEWKVKVDKAGSKKLIFRFANGSSSGNRPMEIKVNGKVVAKSLDFDYTGAWENWKTQSITAELKEGENIIRATALSSSGGPNVDYLQVLDADK